MPGDGPAHGRGLGFPACVYLASNLISRTRIKKPPAGASDFTRAGVAKAEGARGRGPSDEEGTVEFLLAEGFA